MMFQVKSNKCKISAVIACLLTISVCLYVLITSILGYESGSDSEKYHIIVMIVDDMGWNDVGFHGSNEIPTPNIDALAYNGIILGRHYVLPICTPSRTAFFTGRHPIRTGMQGFPLRAGEPRGIPLDTKLLPEYLKKLGYSTQLIGKWHLGYQNDNYTPARRGFDTFFGYYSGLITYFGHTITQAGQTGYDIHRDTPEGLRADWTGLNQYATDVFTDEAIRIIQGHNENEPLYLQISHLAPHAGDSPEEKLETRNFTQVNKTFSYIEDIERRKYAGIMTAVDESLGRIMEALSKKNILKKSIVVFMADNGAPTFGMHGNRGSNYPLRGLKRSLYEGAVHGVACVYSPLIKKSARIVNDLIHMTDWLPTLYAAAGGNVDDLGVIDGVNQWPTISIGQSNGHRDSVLLNIDESLKMSAAIIGPYKLIKGNLGAYNGYYGNTIDDTAPSYNLKGVKTSLTSHAIHKTTGTLVSSKEMLRLRSANQIHCKTFDEYSDCLEKCLFNLDEDPCETTDISNQHPDMVAQLEKYINIYEKILINQTNAAVDPRSYPQNFNGTWMPWLNDESSLIIKIQ